MPCMPTICPTTFTAADYPGLIAPTQTIDTVAVDAVLIAFNWPKGTDRYRRIEKFVDTFFPKLAEFQKAPRHPKWKEANLAATVPGWKRFEGAEEWLRKQRCSRRPQAATAAARAVRPFSRGPVIDEAGHGDRGSRTTFQGIHSVERQPRTPLNCQDDLRRNEASGGMRRKQDRQGVW